MVMIQPRNRMSCLLLICLLVLHCPSLIFAQDETTFKEYDVKAVWLIAFLRFIDWPADAMSKSDTITIGIFGDQPVPSQFALALDTPVKGKKLVIRSIRELQEDTVLSDCLILFIDANHIESLETIIGLVDTKSVLTVSETDAFLENGGIVNFVIVNDQIRFEINQVAAQKSGLRIPSQLLRRAHKVIRKERGNP